MGIRKSDEVSEEVENSDFGNIFHAAADALYQHLSSKANGVITKDALEYYVKNEALLYKFIDNAFSSEFFNHNRPEYNGEQYINRGVLHHFLHHMVKIDMEYAPFIYIGGERKINIPYTIDVNGRSINTAIGGIIDRVDIKDDTINIIDYKTGRSDNDTKTSLENIFANEISSAGYRLQAFLYSIILDELLKGKSTIGNGDFEWINKIKSNPARKISPSLIYINAPANATRENFVVDVMKQPVTDITTIKEEYLEKMQSVLQEIFDADKPFVPAKDEKKCEFCDYREICGK
jgi:ATP-dependent helicase/DNAse subunit B